MLKELKDLLPFLTALLSLLLGSGISWFFFFRSKLRREGNRLLEDEFNALSSVVDKSSRQISELSGRLREMESIRTQLATELNDAKRLMHEIRAENEELKALVAILQANQQQQHDAQHENDQKASERDLNAGSGTTGPRRRPVTRVKACSDRQCRVRYKSNTMAELFSDFADFKLYVGGRVNQSVELDSLATSIYEVRGGILRRICRWLNMKGCWVDR